MPFSSSSSPSNHRRAVIILALLLLHNSPFLDGAPTARVDHGVKLPRPKRHVNLNNDEILISEHFAVPEQKLRFEGLLGCKYDADVCNGNEACFDDTLFGQCWDGRIPESEAFAWKDSVDELTSEKRLALERTIRFLNRYQLDWKEFMSQCLLSHVLVSNARQLDERRLELLYRDCLAKDQLLDDAQSSGVGRRLTSDNSRRLSYYEQQGYTIKPKSQFLDLDGLLALLPPDEEREPSSIEIMPDRELYIGRKPAAFAAQESLMSEPRRLSMQMNEGHPSLVETLQVNNNKQALPMVKNGIRKDQEAKHLDTSRGYVIIDQNFKDQTKGAELLALVAQLQSWTPSIFTHLDAHHHTLTFHVTDNMHGINAQHVIDSIRRHGKLIEDQLGIQIIDVGVGHPYRAAQLSVRRWNGSRLAAIALATGILGAFMLAAVALFYLLQRNQRIRTKLVELPHHKRPSVSDCQDLCPQRAKGQTSERQSTPPEVRRVSPPRFARVKHDSESSSSRSSSSSWADESTAPTTAANMDILTGHLILTYMEDHLRDRHRLEGDWQSLCVEESVDELVACSVALSETNQKKNRYIDCIPYDHTRVRLENNDDGDYINASLIVDSNPKCKYIATQGPTPNTTNAFWQMVWEQGSCVIVALARPIENGATMCHHYWPVEGIARFSDFEVNLVSEHIWSDDYVVRSFYLRNLQTMETRTVTQFHFLTWDELCNPPSAKSVLDFRRKVNKCFRGRASPIIVHCNDGVGRTGAYLLLDVVLNRIYKGAREINIAATLEHLRDQRPRMVKTKDQFQFVFVAVAEEVTELLKSLPQ